MISPTSRLVELLLNAVDMIEWLDEADFQVQSFHFGENSLPSGGMAVWLEFHLPEESPEEARIFFLILNEDTIYVTTAPFYCLATLRGRPDEEREFCQISDVIETGPDDEWPDDEWLERY